ncbi:MAG TPA: peptidylprolyl isomerase [Bryobacteraceae bacterium]|nr:peptidylprolyl isomerase [Bryobacteraceae bacterium]
MERQQGGLVFSATMPGAAKSTLPVKVIMGGESHGLSFLLAIDKLGNLPLARPALIEARYVYNSPNKALARSPGFATEAPTSYEDAFGRVLSPGFQEKCLTCHGEPGTTGAGARGGVQCESCHGPGAEHVAAIRHGKTGGIINPKKLTGERAILVCERCHAGFTERSDPLPNELLVSSQVVALRNSECFAQSGQGLICTNCHDPHRDRPPAEVEKISTVACLHCHSTEAKPRAALCPLNAHGECIGCHMPRVDQGVFQMTDHWIRVHPEQGIHAAAHDPGLQPQFAPLREFLRILVVADREKAERAAAKIAQGNAFSDVAHDVSIDETAAVGGYAGEVWLSQMDPKLAAVAAKLGYGETSGIIDMGNRWMMLQRMPRDFKVGAEALFEQAAARKARGDSKDALAKDVEALRVYPHFLRALVFMGAALGETGEVQQGSQVLAFAAQIYPKDATAQFDLGLTLGASGNHAGQVAAFRRALDLDPDKIAVYESLGAELYAEGLWQGAIDVCRAGLQIDPLAARLYFNLSLMLEQHGDTAEAKTARDLATRIDPAIARQTPSHPAPGLN